MTYSPLSRVLPAALAAAAFVSGGAAHAARETPAEAVLKRLQSLELAPGIEHRQVVIHPIYASIAPPAPAETAALGGVAPPELAAFGKIEKGAKATSDVLNFGKDRLVFLPGDVLRTDSADYAVLRDAVAPTGEPVQVQLVRVSRETASDPKAIESRMLGDALPSALRFLVLSDDAGPKIREAAEKWAEETNLATARRSPAELANGESIAKRVADYRKSFATIGKRAAPAGKELVGCAVLLDGCLAEIEAFGDGKLFADAWPRLLDGVAVEACYAELRTGSIETDVPDPADPDRYLTDLKKKFVEFYAAKTAESELPVKTGRRFALTTPDAVGDALVLGEERVVHAVFVVDPARRTRKPNDDDPNAWQRRMRQTQEEQRRNDRKNGGAPPPLVPPGSPPPAPK